jgi:outer membrane protein TolC
MPPTRLILPLAVVLAAGCSNPLASRPEDFGRETPVERLRRVDSLRMDAFAKPPAPEGAPAEDPAAAAKARFAGLAEFPLTIQDARAGAFEHNLDLKVAVVNPTIAKQSVDLEEARFESTFTLQALWSSNDQPATTIPNSILTNTQSIEPGVTIPLRTGGTATVSLPLTHTDAHSPLGDLPSEDSAALNFSISQPLLRNAGREVATTALRIANYNRQISEAQTKLAVINQLAAVDRAYWRLYQARRSLEVRQQQYELAQAQLDKAERVVRAGRQAEIEVIRAQSGVALRVDDIIVAQNNLLTIQREFKRIVNIPGLEIDGVTMVIPQTAPTPVEYRFDSAVLAKAALDNRMEMLELELQLLQDAANIKFADNQTLPQLDLIGSYGFNGIGRSGQDALHSLDRNKFESWSIGANLAVPLGNEGPRAQLRAAILTRLQRLSSREARKLLIRQDVANAIDTIHAGWDRILATRQSSILAGRELQAEQRQFDVGLATSTDVLDAAARLALAQLDEIQAIVDYQLGQVDLAVATGTLLGASHIQWNPEREPAPKVTPDLITLPPDATATTSPPTDVTPLVPPASPPGGS